MARQNLYLGQLNIADLNGALNLVDGKTQNLTTTGTFPTASLTGILTLANGGTGADLSATGGTSQYVQQTTAGGALTVGAIAAADVPNLDASKITTGKLALARGGTNADLSATGGANQFLKQSTLGGAVTVGALVAGDVPDTALSTNVPLLNRDPQTFTGKQFFNNALRFSLGATGSTPFTIDGTKFVVGATAVGAATINMPASPSAGDAYIIKDVLGQCAANTLTISGNGKNIEGAASITITTNYGVVRLYYTGSEWQQW